MILKRISKIFGALIVAASLCLLWSCALGVGVSMVSIFVPGGPPVGWALVGALSSMGIALAGCAGW